MTSLRWTALSAAATFAVLLSSCATFQSARPLREDDAVYTVRGGQVVDEAGQPVPADRSEGRIVLSPGTVSRLYEAARRGSTRAPSP